MTFNAPPSGLFDIYYDACNWLLANDFTSSDCTLVYPSLNEQCINCTVGMVGGNSTSTYRHGGPMPFNFGSCPLCGGSSIKRTETRETIRLRTYWHKKDWNKIANNIVIAEADVMVIGNIDVLSKVQRAAEILLISNNNHFESRFTLVGKINLHGFGKNRYFIAFLKGA